MVEKRLDEATGVHTVGHEWDGIEELDNPMPRWWLYCLYASIVFAIGYVIVYPAFPGLTGNSKGLWNWSSRGALTEQMAADAARKAPIVSAIAATPIEDLPGRPDLMRAAVQGGGAAFRVHCVQCHGSDAAGSKGYPNLNDDDWLWGGDLKSIQYSITHGVRNPDVPETHAGMMPAFLRDRMLSRAQVEDAVSHVRVISEQEKPSASSRRGASVFADNCAACHGADGKGLRQFGAPNLTDGIWLFGGSREALLETIGGGRQGVMPAWGERLDPVTIKMLAAYVHALGGGEANPAPEAGLTPDAEGSDDAAESPAAP